MEWLEGATLKELCLSLIFPQGWALKHRLRYRWSIWEAIPESIREKVVRMRKEKSKSQYRLSLSRKPPPGQSMLDQKDGA